MTQEATTAMKDETVFSAQEGPQMLLFYSHIQDVLYGGARGGGKSFGILGHFSRHEEEYGEFVKGLLVRRTYAELEDIIGKAKQMFVRVDSPNTAIYYESKKTMVFPSGATLKFRFLEKDKDADRYQGHEYNWICIEEAGNFPSPIPIDKLRACLRSAEGVRTYFLLTANPGGPGHNWIKAAYIDPAQPLEVHTVSTEVMYKGKKIKIESKRMFIPANVYDNKILMENDPNYISNLVKSAGGQEWLLKAWLEGDWNIVAGGMFDDVWDEEKHVLPVFAVPRDWKVYRSFDWGSAKPFSVGWWAVSDGGYAEFGDGEYRIFAKGTLIRVGEWYGWNGTPNVGLRLLESQIIAGVTEHETRIKKKYSIDKVYNGPADSAIFVKTDGQSIAEKHELMGIAWHKAEKGPGSRVRNWQEMRQLLSSAKSFPMEERGMFITEDCLQFRRTVPSIQRDPKDLDDIDTDAEDHICDETAYMARWRPSSINVCELRGL